MSVELHPFVLIIGTQRSGTTLLARMLSSHDDFYVRNEGIPLDAFFSFLFTPSGEKKHPPSIEQIPQLQTVLSAAENKGNTRWGYKDPQFAEHMAQVRSVIGANRGSIKIVIIVRDPRGVANSYMTHKWGLGSNAYTGALRWRDAVDEQTRLLDDFPESAILLRYEDLVYNAEQVLRHVCQHLNVPFQRKMLSYYEDTPDYKINDENTQTNRPPNADIAEKWKGELAANQIKVIEYVCQQQMRRHGYEPIYPLEKVSFLSRARFILHQKTIGELQIQYRWRFSKFFNRGKK